jgi:anti-anti-sigma factor
MAASRSRADFAIRGRLDVTTEADLRAELTAAFDASSTDAEEFVVDLAAVETVDMVGVGLLVGAHRQAGRRGRRLVLTGVPPRVMRLLTVTRLRRVLSVREVPRAVTAPESTPSEQPGTRVVGAA